MALWTGSEIATAIGGKLSSEFSVHGVEFDSREVSDNDLFFALKGEQSDGHLYLDKVFASGGAGAIVSEACEHPHVYVADTNHALDALAVAARQRVDAKIIGVTGSVGKTGTKEALFAALNRSSRGRAHRSVKSYNNHVGVPLSLSRMPADTRFGIFEMGMNHPGELSELTQLVKPDVAIVTTIAPAHAEFFKDETEIADAKGEIFEGLVEDGIAIIPRDSPHFERLKGHAEKYTANIVSFGLSAEADVRAVDVVPSPRGGTLVTAKINGTGLCYTIAAPGEHWVVNSLAILAAVQAVGGDLASAGLALAELEGLDGRGRRHILRRYDGEYLLIDESYNANPASMAATLQQLGKEPAARKVAVLGAMKELGAKSEAYHGAILEHLVAAKVDFVVLVGDEMQIVATKINQGVEAGLKFAQVKDANEALACLKQILRVDDAVLVKGSNSVGLSSLIKALVSEGK